jgi:MacB-like periplasmic core domain/FtsX-like permease family
VKSRLYRALIRVLPFDFRREFGEEMAGVFDDQRVHAQGVTASARLWAGTLGGVLRLAPREHLAILRQDIAYAFRVLRRSPTFTVSAILALALGIGANTAVFSLANAVLLNPLPVANPGRLVSVLTLDRQNPGYSPLSTDNFRDFRARTETLSGAAAFTFLPVRLLGGSESQEAFALAVTGEYFDVLGVRAIAGRTFGPEEDRVKGGSSVVVLTHRLWTTRFGSDRGVIGSTVRLNGQPFTVIGVAPPRFNGTYGLFGPDLFVPFMMYDALAPGAEWFEGRRIRWLNIVARLAPGVSLEQARADAAIQGDRLAKEFPRFNEVRTFTLLPLAHAAINPDRHDTFVRAGWLLAAVVGVVLLVACANLANLLLARAASRSREVAVRLALGASCGRIVRQLVTESLMLGLAGGGAGLALAWWTQRWLWSARPANLQQAAFSLSLDGRILLFTLGVSILAGLAFGLLPAVQVSRSAVNTTLKESGRAPSTASRPRLRAALVIGEVALSIVALTAAGLLLRSLSQAQRIDPGFAVDRGAVMFYNAGGGGYDVPRARGLHEQLLDRLRADPGVRGAALTARPPLSQGEAHTINVTGQAPSSWRTRVPRRDVGGVSRLFRHDGNSDRVRTGLRRDRSPRLASGRRHQRNDGPAVLAGPRSDRPTLSAAQPQGTDRGDWRRARQQIHHAWRRPGAIFLRRAMAAGSAIGRACCLDRLNEGRRGDRRAYRARGDAGAGSRDPLHEHRHAGRRRGSSALGAPDRGPPGDGVRRAGARPRRDRVVRCARVLGLAAAAGDRPPHGARRRAAEHSWHDRRPRAALDGDRRGGGTRSCLAGRERIEFAALRRRAVGSHHVHRRADRSAHGRVRRVVLSRSPRRPPGSEPDAAQLIRARPKGRAYSALNADTTSTRSAWRAGITHARIAVTASSAATVT